MEVTLAGREIVVNPDPEKACLPMLPSKLPLANVTVFNEEHRWKALSAMEVTLAGREIVVNPDCWKACLPMLPSELPLANVTVFNEEH